MQLPKHLPASVRLATPWKNGGGITREVAKDAQPGSAEAFRWRVSIAEVSQEGPFSKFTGYRRIISVIDGYGMELRETGRGTSLLKPFQPHAFDGDAEVYGALPSGPVSDLNVIFQPRAVQASMRFTDGAEQLRPGPGSTVLIVNTGLQSMDCGAGDPRFQLSSWDALLATQGCVLNLPPNHRCAVITLTLSESAHNRFG